MDQILEVLDLAAVMAPPLDSGDTLEDLFKATTHMVQESQEAWAILLLEVLVT